MKKMSMLLLVVLGSSLAFSEESLLTEAPVCQEVCMFHHHEYHHSYCLSVDVCDVSVWNEEAKACILSDRYFKKTLDQSCSTLEPMFSSL